MENTKKIVTVVLWSFLVVVMVAIVALGLQWQRQQLPVLFDAPSFSLIDQNNHPFTDKDLRGKVWICDLIFTQCAGPCPTMTANMSQLQKTLSDSRIHFVSFSVDPDNDTPAILKQYAEKFSADPARWSFLTGDKNTIYSTARALNLGAAPGSPASSTQPAEPPSHDTHFLLVDPAGHVRGIYEMKDGQAMTKLTEQVRMLLAEAKE